MLKYGGKQLGFNIKSMVTEFHNLPRGNFEEMRVVEVLSHNYPFLCPECKTMCVLQEKIDVEYTDEVEISCNFCNNVIHIDANNLDHGYVETPVMSTICKFENKEEGVNPNVKNHELYEC